MNLYVVRSQDGKFFRAVGYGGGGSNWVDTLDRAKFYPKIGPAKSRVTFFAREYPQYGVCDVLEFTLDASQAKMMDMKETTVKAKVRIERKKLQREQNHREHEIKSLERDRDRMANRLKELKP